MKKIYSILAISCLAVLTLASCQRFLDWPPTDSASAETSITSVSDAEIMLTGVMNKLTSSSYLGRNMFMYADTKGGDLCIVSAGRGMDAMFKFNQSASGTNYSGFWQQGFNVILQINNIIENVEALEAEGASGFDNILGQAYTLRAMVYFDLVRLYGRPYNYQKTSWGVPNITTRIDAGAKEVRVTVETNYQQIVSDLKKGEGLISKSVNNGFINYYGNKALQARVCLYMDNYAGALAAAEEIINSNVYKLYENSEWVSSWSKMFGTESIFELIMDDTTTGLGSSSLGGYYARYKDYGNVLGYFVNSTNFIENILGEDPTDIRWGVYTYDETSTTRMGCCYKYLGGVDKPGDGKSQAGNVNIKVIRLSEIYLIAAEAALETGSKSKAASYLNKIRRRSPGLAPATESTVSVDMILNERSKELQLEGHRFFDMMRRNKTITFDDEMDPAAGAYQRGHTIDRTSYLTVLPIPQREIIINPDLQQNEGY